MRDTVKKIYEFITKLVFLLEDELKELKQNGKKSTISTQKNITDILNKLVNLISQLNKISKENKLSSKSDFSKGDKEILSKYIEKIRLEMKQNNAK